MEVSTPFCTFAQTMENENWFVRERVVEIGWERQEELLVYWEEERIGESETSRFGSAANYFNV